MELNETQGLPPHHAPTSLRTLLLIFGVLVVVALGYLVWAQNSDPDATDYSATSVKKTETETETAVTDETADWKTYANASFKFSLKYPPNYTLTDTLQNAGDTTPTASQKLLIQGQDAAGKPWLTIWVNPPGFDGAPTNLLYNLTVGTDGTLSVKSKTAQEVAVGEWGYDGTRQLAGTNLSGMAVKDNMYVIQFSYETGSDTAALKTFDSIISTFKAT